jgi:hypothetical protein
MTRSAFAVLASIYRNRFNVMLNLEKSIAALAIALPGVMQAQTSEFSALCVRQAWGERVGRDWCGRHTDA